MSVSFKLVHLSDLHFANAPNRLPSPAQDGGVRGLLRAIGQGHRGNWFRAASHSTRAARAVSRYLATQLLDAERPDALVITGDLATTGSAQDLSAALKYLDHPGDDWVTQDDEPRLVTKGVPIRVMPGNHDRYLADTLLPGCMNFEEIFSEKFWEATDFCDRLSKPFEIQRNGERLVLICADFSYRALLHAYQDADNELHSFIGKGLAYQDVVDGLQQMTIDIQSGSDPAAVVWLVHYPPVFPDGNRDLFLDEESRLLDAADACGVRVVLAGHTHESKIYPVGSSTVSCVGSAMQHDSASKWHFALVCLDVEGGKIVSGDVTSFDYQKSGRNNFVRGSKQAI